jgi:branched-chain amino acid transport system permease protein
MNSTAPLRLTTAVLLVVLTFVVPLTLSPDVTAIVTTALLFGFLATAWNITGAWGSRLSLGHSIFVGVGAYASTVLFIHTGLTPWVGMLAGAAVAAAAGAAMGWMATRYGLEGIFFAMVTLALALLAVQLASNLEPIGAAQGLLIPLRGDSGVDYQFRDAMPFNVIAGVLVFAAIAFTWWLRDRRLGSWIAAVGLNEKAARASGVAPVAVSAKGLALGGAIAALGGTFYAQQNLYVDPPSTLDWSLSLAILLPAIIGGRKRPEGPLFGALLLIPLEEVLRIYVDPGYSGMLRGVALILVVRFLPDGVLPPLERTVGRLVAPHRPRVVKEHYAGS